MDNEKRSQALYINALFYSAITVGLLISSVVRLDLGLLRASFIMFITLCISLLLSSVYVNKEEDLPNSISAISFIILLPLAMLILTLTFIVSTIVYIFKKDRGGDDYYD